MIKTFSLITLATIILISTAIANNNRETQIATDEKNVINIINNMTQSFHQSDIDGVMANYEQNATVVFEPGKPISDPAILRKMFKQAFTLNPKFRYSGHEVFISKNIAIHFAPWTMKANAPDGSLIKQSGLSVAVLRRQADGRWLMVIDNPHGQFLMGQNKNSK